MELAYFDIYFSRCRILKVFMLPYKIESMEYCYQTYETILGDLTLISDGKSIVTVHYGAGEPQGCYCDEDQVLMEAIFEINQYLMGQRKTFDVPVDPMGNEKEKKLYRYVKDNVPYGKFGTYEGLAEALDMDPQDVEKMLETNSCPILIPCHRVIRANKKIGVYVGDISLKNDLLKLEHKYR